MDYKLNILGIIPRYPISLIAGPVCSSFLHVDLNHLLYNSAPLLAMCAFLFSQGINQAMAIIFSISILKSLMVWLFARDGIHIGASGLIVGLFAHFLFQGYYNPGIMQVMVAFVILYYFGSLLFSIFPSDLLTSFEGHLFGMISGLIVSYFGPPLFIMNLTIPIAQTITLLVNTL